MFETILQRGRIFRANIDLRAIRPQQTARPSASTPRFTSNKNEQGDGYEPRSLKVMMTALDRYWKEKGCTSSLIGDRQFSWSKQDFDAIAEQLCVAVQTG